MFIHIFKVYFILLQNPFYVNKGTTSDWYWFLLKKQTLFGGNGHLTVNTLVTDHRVGEWANN